LIQPVDGQFHYNPREYSSSCRSEESGTSWRYLGIESDQAPRDLWLKMLVSLPLPISMIAESGKRSIQALVRVDAQTKEDWDEQVNRLKTSLKILGADTGAMQAVQLLRLPNCQREETGRPQRLLYLDDDPSDTPISSPCPVLSGTPEMSIFRWIFRRPINRSRAKPSGKRLSAQPTTLFLT
jgi:hypothetical protein